MKKTFRVQFKKMAIGYFRAVVEERPLPTNWYNCPEISDCPMAKELEKHIKKVGDIKSAKVTIEFD